MAAATTRLPIDLDDAQDHHDETCNNASQTSLSDPWPTGLRNRKLNESTENGFMETESEPSAPWPAAQMLPSISSSSYDNDFDDDCPAARAAAAVQALSFQPLHDEIDDEHDASLQEQVHLLQRMDTVGTSHTSKQSLDQWQTQLFNDASPKRSNQSSSPDGNPFPTNSSCSNLYTFSPTPTGRILTAISNKPTGPYFH
jgi:hypothetical protein